MSVKLNMIPNDEFICPLTLSIMNDPVMTITGRSFERVAIMEWLARGNTTCPLSRQVLQVTDLVTNHSLHTKIKKWKQQQQQLQKNKGKKSFHPESTTFTDDDSSCSSCCYECSQDDNDDIAKKFMLPCFVSMPKSSSSSSGEEQEQEDGSNNNVIINRRIQDMMNNQEQWDAFQQRVQEQLRQELQKAVAEQERIHNQNQSFGCGMKKLWKGIRNGTNKKVNKIK
jgi:U-box domain